MAPAQLTFVLGRGVSIKVREVVEGAAQSNIL
jgi:hypothetical protein